MMRCTQNPHFILFLQGVTKISNYLLSKKQGHSFVVLVNLRNDVAVECDGKAYSVRDATLLDEPIIHPGLTKEVLEVILSLKKSLQCWTIQSSTSDSQEGC